MIRIISLQLVQENFWFGFTNSGKFIMGTAALEIFFKSPQKIRMHNLIGYQEFIVVVTQNELFQMKKIFPCILVIYRSVRVLVANKRYVTFFTKKISFFHTISIASLQSTCESNGSIFVVLEIGGANHPILLDKQDTVRSPCLYEIAQQILHQTNPVPLPVPYGGDIDD